MTDTPTYAWCFSHGTHHRFAGEPWCTATWTPLAGDNEDEALADKAARFGDAFFIDQLPVKQQLELIGVIDPAEEQP